MSFVLNLTGCNGDLDALTGKAVEPEQVVATQVNAPRRKTKVTFALEDCSAVREGKREPRKRSQPQRNQSLKYKLYKREGAHAAITREEHSK